MLQRSVEALLGANPALVLAVAALYAAWVYLGGRRWQTLLLGLEEAVRLRETILANLAFTFLNNVTPGRLGGEIGRVVVLQLRTRVDLRRAAASAAYDRLLDWVPAPLFLLLALPALPDVARRGHLGPLALVLAAGVAALALLRAASGEHGWRQRLRAQLARVHLPRGPLLRALGISLLVWAADILRLAAAAAAFGVWLKPSQAVGLCFAAAAGAAVPMMGGLGVVEASLTATLCLYGVPVETALAIALLDRSISYVLATAASGLVVLALGGRRLWRAVRSPPRPAHDGTAPA
ncbi:MAG: lysylphosphatidylglycerol synthase transmembrane domain-containing protein [Myxococcales bacterium]|nr:lysylphosphatidylglycerol synthase transmembrane domain-containing protein [Myxococcales bacterium]